MTSAMLAVACIFLSAVQENGSADEAASEGDAILGHWYTAGEITKLEIYREEDRYFGRIVWLAEPTYPEDDPDAHQPRRDRENPDPDLQDVPIIGLEFIYDLEYTGNGRYRNGRIYNPDNGKTYRCNVQLEGPDELRLRGYIGLPALGRSETWHRAPAPEGEADAAGDGGEA